MILIPLRYQSGYRLLVILEDGNVTRILRQDPVELRFSQLEGFGGKSPDVVQIVHAAPDDLKKIVALATDGKIIEAVKMATRGWEFRPDAGDHDSGPVSLLREPKA